MNHFYFSQNFPVNQMRPMLSPIGVIKLEVVPEIFWNLSCKAAIEGINDVMLYYGATSWHTESNRGTWWSVFWVRFSCVKMCFSFLNHGSIV